jgi:hypothetical protein
MISFKQKLSSIITSGNHLQMRLSMRLSCLMIRLVRIIVFNIIGSLSPGKSYLQGKLGCRTAGGFWFIKQNTFHFKIILYFRCRLLVYCINFYHWHQFCLSQCTSILHLDGFARFRHYVFPFFHFPAHFPIFPPISHFPTLNRWEVGN